MCLALASCLCDRNCLDSSHTAVQYSRKHYDKRETVVSRYLGIKLYRRGRTVRRLNLQKCFPRAAEVVIEDLPKNSNPMKMTCGYFPPPFQPPLPFTVHYLTINVSEKLCQSLMSNFL